MSYLGCAVVYTPHDGETVAGLVTRVRGATVDLITFPPNAGVSGAEAVPHGDGPHSYREALPPMPAELSGYTA